MNKRAEKLLATIRSKPTHFWSVGQLQKEGYGAYALLDGMVELEEAGLACEGKIPFRLYDNIFYFWARGLPMMEKLAIYLDQWELYGRFDKPYAMTIAIWFRFVPLHCMLPGEEAFLLRGLDFLEANKTRHTAHLGLCKLRYLGIVD